MERTTSGWKTIAAAAATMEESARTMIAGFFLTMRITVKTGTRSSQGDYRQYGS